MANLNIHDKVKQVEELFSQGTPIVKACKEVGISRAAYYKHRSRLEKTERRGVVDIVHSLPVLSRDDCLRILSAEILRFRREGKIGNIAGLSHAVKTLLELLGEHEGVETIRLEWSNVVQEDEDDAG